MPPWRRWWRSPWPRAGRGFASAIPKRDAWASRGPAEGGRFQEADEPAAPWLALAAKAQKTLEPEGGAGAAALAAGPLQAPQDGDDHPGGQQFDEDRGDVGAGPGRPVGAGGEGQLGVPTGRGDGFGRERGGDVVPVRDRRVAGVGLVLTRFVLVPLAALAGLAAGPLGGRVAEDVADPRQERRAARASRGRHSPSGGGRAAARRRGLGRGGGGRGGPPRVWAGVPPRGACGGGGPRGRGACRRPPGRRLG